MTKKIFELLVPPAMPKGSPDWMSFESELGTALPEDYKRFVTSYGSGKIDGFLSVFTPEGRTQWVDLLWRSRDHEEIGFSRLELHPPFPSFPAEGGLLAFGQTDNGDALYWRTTGSPVHWTVLAYEGRGPEYFEFAGSMTAFLEGVLSGELRVSVFPQDFPSTNPKFEPYSDG